MINNELYELLLKQFPKATIDKNHNNLEVGSLPEWDSLAHFNFLLLIEEKLNMRFSVEEMTDLKSLSDIQNALIRKGKIF